MERTMFVYGTGERHGVSEQLQTCARRTDRLMGVTGAGMTRSRTCRAHASRRQRTRLRKRGENGAAREARRRRIDRYEG